MSVDAARREALILPLTAEGHSPDMLMVYRSAAPPQALK